MIGYKFLSIYGVTQDPETKECMIVMQYANNGSLLSFLDQNINTREHLDNWHHAGIIHSRILFSFLPRRTLTIE